MKELSRLLDSLAKALPQGEQVAVATLAQAITDGRDRALGTAQAVPPAIKADLLPYFRATPEVLERARWVAAEAVGGLPDLVMLNPAVGALTLDQVIVFRDEADARSNRALWAHELVHVLQFQSLGVEAFAREYLETGGRTLEKEAEDFAEQVRRRLEANQPIQSLAAPPAPARG
jgi:hypothetical protein